MKTLTILDLDNTLIFATEKRIASLEILFSFFDYYIYQRPYVTEFICNCNDIGDIVVYTTAERKYANLVCKNLDIKYIELLCREDCLITGCWLSKSVPECYFKKYDDITIIDDFPQIWDKNSHDKCKIIGVSGFRGSKDDIELKKLII